MRHKVGFGILFLLMACFCHDGRAQTTVVFVDGETPAGATDGVNRVFTLLAAPNPPASLKLYRNGIYQKTGKVATDYTLAGAKITFTVAATPVPGDVLVADYRQLAGALKLRPVNVEQAGEGIQTRVQPSQIRNWKQVKVLGRDGGVALSQLVIDQTLPVHRFARFVVLPPSLPIIPGTFNCAGRVDIAMADEWMNAFPTSIPTCYGVVKVVSPGLPSASLVMRVIQ